ncbi:MAG: hypothetical protein ACFE0Q_18985, partial [Anaerolineae bacterium]
PTSQPTSTDTATPQPTHTNTVTPEPTSTDTATPQPTSTDTVTPQPTSTDTVTPEPTSTDTVTPEPTSTDTVTPQPSEVEAIAAIATVTATSRENVSPTPTMMETGTPTEGITDVFAAQETSLAEANTLSTQEALHTPLIEETTTPGQRLPWEALIGGSLFLFVVIYIWFYWQGLSTAERYANGFVIDTCPVCQRGSLQIDQRTTRILGIPNSRHTVRCDVCRSVLRQTGTERWRYAVDRLENPTMYERFNGRQVTDTDLTRLTKTPPQGRRSSPEFVQAPPEDESDS